MQFKPKTEKEITESNLIPAKTICDFEVVKAEDAKSKSSGAEMLTLKLKVFWNEGFKLMDDYLLESTAAKLRHFCEAGDLMKQYADGSLRAEHCLGICGKLKVNIEDKNDGYPPKNKVQDYVVPKREKVLAATAKPATPQAPAAQASDGVPF